MDAIVEAALRKWPNVPHCHGWLALGARGDWYMRDERVQRAGPFPQVRGSRIEHAKLREFIHRNYASDADGGWYFQNGPQRVYVDLEVAPFVWRLAGTDAPGEPPRVTAHTGAAAQPRECVVDEQGRVYLDTDLGFGLVHTLDTLLAAEAVERGLWMPEVVGAASLPARYGYRLTPRPAE
jgi:hypothetical protein